MGVWIHVGPLSLHLLPEGFLGLPGKTGEGRREVTGRVLMISVHFGRCSSMAPFSTIVWQDPKKFDSLSPFSEIESARVWCSPQWQVRSTRLWEEVRDNGVC